MSCNQRELAKSYVGSITCCECGTISVHCGNVSFRLPKQLFTIFTNMVDDAHAKFAAQELLNKPQ